MSNLANAPSKTWNLKTLLRLTEDEARTFLEGVRWPSGVTCPHCGVVGEATKLATKPGSSTRPGVWKCKPCRKQFTVTVGTVMERSHIPLSTWAAAFFLICSSKKSMSALQLQRQLGISSYKAAWFLAHRVRYAMANGPMGELLKGAIEADETFVGGKPRKRAKRPDEKFTPRLGKQGHTMKQPVALLLERGGRARAKLVRDVTMKSLARFVRSNVNLDESKLYTDEAAPYRRIGKFFAHGHEAVNHSEYEYARPGGIHSNTAESFFSLFKRGFHGAFHHLSPHHMQRYLDEFSFRWTHKDEKDETRTIRALQQAAGVRLMYRRPKVSPPLRGMA